MEIVALALIVVTFLVAFPAVVGVGVYLAATGHAVAAVTFAVPALLALLGATAGALLRHARKADAAA